MQPVGSPGQFNTIKQSIEEKKSSKRAIPMEVFEKAVAYIARADDASGIQMSRLWNDVKIKPYREDEVNLFFDYLCVVNEEIDKEKYPEIRKEINEMAMELAGLRKDKPLLVEAWSLSEVTHSLCQFRKRMCNALKKMSKEDLQALQEHLKEVKTPSVFKDAVNLSLIYNRYDGLLKNPDDTNFPHFIREQVLKPLASSGDVDKALQIANTFSDQSDKDMALASIAGTLNRQGLVGKAKEVASKIETDLLKKQFETDQTSQKSAE